MSKKNTAEINIPEEVIVSKIYLIKGHKVMLDSDLAELYDVPTRRLNEQVKRNQDRFPDDFMFTLTTEEWQDLKSQNATSTGVSAKSWGGRRTLPNAFTEHGVLMLSSVLNSQQAIKTNIQIMRIYNKMRQMLITHQDLLLKFNELEARVGKHDQSISQIFAYLKQLLQEQSEPREPIGFKPTKKE
ncbi:MAG: ORF6N domain-containing protein [Tunicatimonas sp.]